MPVTVAGLWETKWMEPERTERRIWKQTIQAYGVDRWVMAPGEPGRFTSPEQYATIDEMMANLEGTPPLGVRTFLVCPKTAEGIPLERYNHPHEATYVFGRTSDNLMRFRRPHDEIVSIYTPNDAPLFGHAVVGTVLFDRQRKL